MYDNLFNTAPSSPQSSSIPAADSTNSNQLFKTMLANSLEERDKTLFTKLKDKLSHLKKRHIFLIALAIIVTGVYYVYSSGIIDLGSLFARSDLVQTASKSAEVVANEDGSARIKVYVLGAVKQPGVYDLSLGDRIDDALSVAGGAQADAALIYINLAVKVEDGQEIYVPTQAEIDSGYFEKISGVIAAGGVTGALASGAGPSSQSSSTNSAGAASTGGIVNGKVNINKATLAELQTLAGIGAATAQKIVDYRTANGAFSTIDQLKNVSGIGDAKYAAVAGLITV